MTIVNLTPHALSVIDSDNKIVASIPSTGLARATQTDRPVGMVQTGGVQIPLVETVFGAVEGLPEPDGETMYVVSLITAQAAIASGRGGSDLLYPSGVPVRDANGQILGVRALARAE